MAYDFWDLPSERRNEFFDEEVDHSEKSSRWDNDLGMDNCVDIYLKK